MQLKRALRAVARNRVKNVGVYSSVVERCPDKTEVLGPIPSTRTKQNAHRISVSILAFS